MAEVTGIIYNDIFFASKDQFMQHFISYYKEHKAMVDNVAAKLSSILNSMKKTVTEASAEQFSIAWKEFQQVVLLNKQPLQLLVAYRGSQGKLDQISAIINQEDVEEYGKGRYGINTDSEKLKEEAKQIVRARKVEQFLQRHLNGFINALYRKATTKEAEILHEYHSNLIQKEYAEHYDHITDKRFQEIFYGTRGQGSQYWGGRGLGNVYDAFMNHVANHEKFIFNFLSAQGRTVVNFNFPRTSVFTEEGGITPTSHLPQLLHDSLNSIGWYTGGDIVIVNPKTMEVVYNIQLKSTGKNINTTFEIHIAELKGIIDMFTKAKTPEEKAQWLFEKMKTSVSNFSELEHVIEQDTYNIVEQTLKSR